MDAATRETPLPRHWVNTFFLIFSPVMAFVGTPIVLYLYGASLWIFVFMVIGMGASSMSITAGYHRLYSHRSYEANGLVRLLFLLFGAAAFQGSVVQWVADHRRHHRHADSEGDPHNINKGFLWAHVGWLFYKDPRGLGLETVPDLTRDRLVMWQHNHYVTIAIAMGFGLPALIGWACGGFWAGLFLVGFVRIVFTNHATFLINSLAHTVGKRPYDDQQTARDSLLMAVLAYGEGYHNFHHQFASDYRNGSRWYHWDPTKWLIRILALVGLARSLKITPAAEILRARLRMDATLLVASGCSEEVVTTIKLRVENTQARWRQLKEDYRKFKTSFADQSRQRLKALKGEIKLARLEFKFALAQWGVFRRTRGRALPAFVK